MADIRRTESQGKISIGEREEVELIEKYGLMVEGIKEGMVSMARPPSTL